MTPATERIARMRRQALDVPRHWSNPERALLVARAWKSTGEVENLPLRRAQIVASVLSGMTPVIGPDDIVVGKACMRPLSPEEQAELDEWTRVGQPCIPQMTGMSSHMAVDFESVLKEGVEGIRDRVARHRATLRMHMPDEVDRSIFYDSCIVALDGLLDAADGYARLAQSMALSEPDARRREELKLIAATCAKVPRKPAETFREAVQSVHFVNAMLTLAGPGLYQLGRPDRYLARFYQRDLECGLITRDEAQELWDCVCILFNECVPRGLAVGYMVGGRDAAGKDVSNELTEIMLESIGHTHMVYPGVGLCRTKDTPAYLISLSAELLAHGYSHPAIFGDEVITEGMAGLGCSPVEACEYIHSTCVEITPVACSGVWVASPYINLVQLLQDSLAADHRSFETLMESVRSRLDEVVTEAAEDQNRMRASRYHQGGQPLVSCFVNDCIEKGRDIDQGGARYNWIEMSFVGLANLVDALAAIRTLVFERREVSLAELAKALEGNFEGQEALRLTLLNKCPKYGNDLPEVDDLAVEITGWVEQACAKHRAYLDSAFVPGFFCWVMHEYLGRQTGASADGRRAGFALGDGSGPAQGRERKGPTAAVLSTTKWNHAPMIGGVAMNLKFTPDPDRERLERNIADVVTTYCDQGGFEIQVNVVDNATLRAAQADHENYRDLVVRIGGYSDYFVALSPGMQEEVIARSEMGFR